jgi:type IV pilus assembly protein PilO
MGTAALVVLVLLAGWFLVISPKKADAAQSQADTAAQEQINQGLKTKIMVLQAANAALPAEEAKLAQIRQQIPLTPQLPSFIRQISSMATSSGATVVSVSPQNPAGVNTPAVTYTGVASGAAAVQDTQLQQMSFAMTVLGSYPAIERYINLMERSTRLVLVTGLDIKPTSTTGANGSNVANGYSATVQFRLFRAAPVTSTTPTTAAAPASGHASPTSVN